MIEYCKLILQKVSFSPVLFEKELRKSLTFIREEDRLKFIHWCKATFSSNNDVINQYEMILVRKS